jgi:hypothetical protein
MSFSRATRYGFTPAIAAAIVTLLATPAVAQDAPAPTPAVSVSGGVDFVNRYMFRGIRQNASGIATWPFFDVGIAAFEGDGGLKKLSFNIGSWNSAHSAEPLRGWYESDIYGTVGLGFGGGVTLGTTYTSYTSPKEYFTHVKELSFKLSVDDSAYLGSGALKPYALFAVELGTEPGKYQADAGENAGKYLELGIAPGYSAAHASLAVPLKVGLSVGDYYELGGVDNKFGFFSAAGIVTVPVGPNWNVHGGVEVQALGDTTKALNGGDSSRVIGSFGVGFAY